MPKDLVDSTLRAFAASYGKRWRHKLQMAWFSGRYPCPAAEVPALQRIRNDPSFGPAYLNTFKV